MNFIGQTEPYEMGGVVRIWIVVGILEIETIEMEAVTRGSDVVWAAKKHKTTSYISLGPTTVYP